MSQQTETIPEQQIPEQQTPTGPDIMKRLRNQVKLSYSDGEERALKVVDIYEKQIVAAANQIMKQSEKIIRYEDLMTKGKIDFSVPKPKKPNRNQRRAAAKAAKKAAKVTKKTQMKAVTKSSKRK